MEDDALLRDLIEHFSRLSLGNAPLKTDSESATTTLPGALADWLGSNQQVSAALKALNV